MGWQALITSCNQGVDRTGLISGTGMARSGLCFCACSPGAGSQTSLKPSRRGKIPVECMQHLDFRMRMPQGMWRMPEDEWLAGKTSLPASLRSQETQSSCCLCAGLLSTPSAVPLINKDLQPPKIGTASLPPALQRPWLRCPRQEQPGQGVEMGWRADLALRVHQIR